VRLYFASDVHASRKCWLKFLAAPRFYKVDTIIIGGDITGKFIVPLIRQPDGSFRCTFLGIERRVKVGRKLDQLKTQIANTGQYAFETKPDEYAEYENDQAAIDALFMRLVMDRVREWVQLADERLDPGIRCFVSGANDDFMEVDDVLATSKRIEMPEGKVVELADGFEMASVGYGNPTPWNCPRDVPEDQLLGKIDDVAGRVGNPARAIFNLHVPPFGSGLDLAPRLDDNLTVVHHPGSAEPEMVPVGSTAVRDAILEYQPMLGLHGHIHESRGIRQIGSTTVVNPGSEYAEGILDGVVIELEPAKGIVELRMVSG